MRRSIIFLILCSALDAGLTLISTSRGVPELNPRVAWMLSVSPLLYILFNAALITAIWTIDRALKSRVEDVWLIWVSAGIPRLICFSWTLIGLILPAKLWVGK